MLTFKETEHEYYWNDKRVPGVTEVLHEFGLVPMFNNSTNAVQKGEGVHKAIKLLEKDDLEYCPEWVKPYLEQWNRFKQEYYKQGDLVDVKSGGMYPYYKAQLAAYKILIEENKAKLGCEEALFSRIWNFAGTPDYFSTIKGKIKRQYILLLTPDDYRPVPVDEKIHEVVFKSMLTVKQYKEAIK